VETPNPKQQPNQQPNQQPEQQMTPEQQEQYDMFVINAINMIHTKDVSQSILTRIAHSQHPLDGIAGITVDMANRVVESAQENGMEISQAVLVHGGNAVLGEVINVAESAGMEPLSEEQKTEAFQRAAAKFLDNSVKSGKISPEQLTQMGEEAQQSPQGQQIMQEMGGQQPGILGGQNEQTQ